MQHFSQAHLAGVQTLEHLIAEHFTQADGSNPLYAGREGIYPGACAWPIQHDAPYKPQMDAVMAQVNEVSS